MCGGCVSHVKKLLEAQRTDPFGLNYVIRKPGPRPDFILALISVGTIILDQVTKTQIMQTMRLHESIPVIANFFSLTYIRNPGAASAGRWAA